MLETERPNCTKTLFICAPRRILWQISRYMYILALLVLSSLDQLHLYISNIQLYCFCYSFLIFQNMQKKNLANTRRAMACRPTVHPTLRLDHKTPVWTTNPKYSVWDLIFVGLQAAFGKTGGNVMPGPDEFWHASVSLRVCKNDMRVDRSRTADRPEGLNEMCQQIQYLKEISPMQWRRAAVLQARFPFFGSNICGAFIGRCHMTPLQR